MQLSQNSEPEMLGKVQIGERPYWLFEDGSFFPVVSGGDGSADDDDDEDDDDGDDGDDKSKSKPRQLSEEDVKRIAAREKREGKAQGKKEFLKSLGLESEDDLKEVLAAHREAQDAKKSEADKLAEKATKDRADADSERAAAKVEKNMAKCERALLREGDFTDSQVEKISKLLDLDLTDDLELDDAKDAVKALKDEMPQLFPEADGEEDDAADSKGKNKNGDPGKQRKPTGDKKSNAEAARDILNARHPKKEPVNQGGGS